MPLIKDKLAICYTCFGETFRESTIDKLQNSYTDDENLYYFQMRVQTISFSLLQLLSCV